MRLNTFLFFLLVCLIVSIPVFGTGCASTGDPEMDMRRALDQAESLVLTIQTGIDFYEVIAGPLDEADQAKLDNLRERLETALARVRELRERLGEPTLPEDTKEAVKALRAESTTAPVTDPGKRALVLAPGGVTPAPEVVAP